MITHLKQYHWDLGLNLTEQRQVARQSKPIPFSGKHANGNQAVGLRDAVSDLEG